MNNVYSRKQFLDDSTVVPLGKLRHKVSYVVDSGGGVKYARGPELKIM